MKFNKLLMWACLGLAGTTALMACIYPFNQGDIQSVCRAYPAEYELWQYAPSAEVTHEQRYSRSCGEAASFHAAFASAWQIFNQDTIKFCVVCETLTQCPEFNTCQ